MLEVYKNIKKFRLERGYSQTKLAELAGYKDKTAISHIELGKRKLTPDKVIRFADALGVSPMDLMGWSDEQRRADIVSVLLENNDNEFYNLIINIVKQYRDSNDENKQKMYNLLSAYSDTLK